MVSDSDRKNYTIYFPRGSTDTVYDYMFFNIKGESQPNCQSQSDIETGEKLLLLFD